MGGEPLDRSGGMNKVDSIAAILAEEKFRLAVLRKELAKVDQLKTGFYYIALKANVPIILLHLILKKEVNLGTPLMPTGNIDEELIILKSILKE
jgi:hypothetical protein